MPACYTVFTVQVKDGKQQADNLVRSYTLFLVCVCFGRGDYILDSFRKTLVLCVEQTIPTLPLHFLFCSKRMTKSSRDSF